MKKRIVDSTEQDNSSNSKSFLDIKLPTKRPKAFKAFRDCSSNMQSTNDKGLTNNKFTSVIYNTDTPNEKETKGGMPIEDLTKEEHFRI